MPTLSIPVRNAMLNALIATVGASPIIQIRTGAAPSITASDSGTLLASYTLAASWAEAAVDGSIHLSSAPLTTAASADGTAGHFRLKSSGGTTHITGTVTITGGDGDITVDSLSIFSGGTVSITSWYINTPN